MKLDQGQNISFQQEMKKEIQEIRKENQEMRKENQEIRSENRAMIEGIKLEMRKENEDIRNCKICFEKIQDRALYILCNCGHLPFCNDCSNGIISARNPKCPICRENVNKRMRAYL